MKRRAVVLIILLLLASFVFVFSYFALQSAGRSTTPTVTSRRPVILSTAPVATPIPTPSPTATPPPAPTPTSLPEVDTPTSVATTVSTTSGVDTCDDLRVLVDKTHGLPESYVPSDLVSLASYNIPASSDSVVGRSIMVTDLQKLFAAIQNAGITGLEAVSVYRSYDLQTSIYNSYVQSYGEADASRFSAQPGHSQHQLGTAIDFSTSELGLNYTLSDVFGQTKAGQWLLANAYKYGFYISYPDGYESTTGYEYEPWHFRYLGEQNALALQESGMIMQTYLAQKNLLPAC